MRCNSLLLFLLLSLLSNVYIYYFHYCHYSSLFWISRPLWMHSKWIRRCFSQLILIRVELVCLLWLGCFTDTRASSWAVNMFLQIYSNLNMLINGIHKALIILTRVSERETVHCVMRYYFSVGGKRGVWLLTEGYNLLSGDVHSVM